MRRAIVMLAVLIGTANIAHADNDFFCSADSKGERFTLETGFDEGLGHKLTNFTGALSVKDTSAVSSAFGRRIFGPDDLVNHWPNDGEIRLEVYQKGESETHFQSLDLIVMANEKAKASGGSFSGTYVLRIEGPSASYHAEGKVSCGTK